jgi:hypothetical protein
MNIINQHTHAPLDLTDQELELLTDLLESSRTRLLVEIRHTDHRSFRGQLAERLDLVERLLQRCATASVVKPAIPEASS